MDHYANIPEDLVETVAVASNDLDRQISFASKFSHFNCDPEKFPISDSRAQIALRVHLEGKIVTSATYPSYRDFRSAFSKLRADNRVSASSNELDHYLYLFGCYVTWDKAGVPINREILAIFEAHVRQPDPDVLALLPMNYDKIPYPRKKKYL